MILTRLKPEEFWELAASWGSYIRGGDPGACMYGFDQRGMVHDEEHRRACIRWINQHCRSAARTHLRWPLTNDTEWGDLDRELDRMIAYLHTAPSANLDR